MFRVPAILIALFLGACSDEQYGRRASTQCAPFGDLHVSGATAEHREILRQASDDFCAVLAGGQPVHAKMDTGFGPSDGGTLFYTGNKYKLTALYSLSLFGSHRGAVVGPILEFDESFALGHTREISNLRFIPTPASRDER